MMSSDRFLLKILDQTVSFQDIQYELRNLQALSCIFDDSLVIHYFEKSFIKDLGDFVGGFPVSVDESRRYLHGKESVLLKTRYLFKMLHYSGDQKTLVPPELSKLISRTVKDNKCSLEVLSKTGLKNNFLDLVELELFLRARYGGQLKGAQGFDTIRSSVELFVESLDKQFSHEYYW